MLVLALLLAAPAAAKRKTRRVAPPASPLRVAPSPEIEARVKAEVEKARAIAGELNQANLFDSPYLVSAVYYHDGFLSTYPAEKEDGDPARRILSQLTALATPEFKARYIRLLREAYPSGGGERSHTPAKNVRRRRTHPHALDLFAPEGSPVYSVSTGVVVLSEGGWTKGEPFSSSSQSGGNSVIVFEPGSRLFHRYCHLESVRVKPGDRVEDGTEVGAVGHTGWNASRPGHGGHLHYEATEFTGAAVRALPREELITLIKSTPPVRPRKRAA